MILKKSVKNLILKNKLKVKILNKSNYKKNKSQKNKMINRKQKSSQIFTLDIILSIIVLLITFSVIVNYYSVTNQNQNLYSKANLIMETLTTTKLNKIEVNLGEEGIEKIEKNLINLLIELENSTKKEELFNETILDKIERNIQANISYYGEGVFENIFLKNETQQENAQIKATIKRLIYGFENSTNFYGPYTIEVSLWQ